jgi:hypothetical protein
LSIAHPKAPKFIGSFSYPRTLLSTPDLCSLLKTSAEFEVFYYNSSILSRKYIIKRERRFEYAIILKEYLARLTNKDIDFSNSGKWVAIIARIQLLEKGDFS